MTFQLGPGACSSEILKYLRQTLLTWLMSHEENCLKCAQVKVNRKEEKREKFLVVNNNAHC